MNVWLIKCREHLPDREGWTWDWYFDPKRRIYLTDDEWGGPEWIRSKFSKKFIREEVKKGDLVVCYQSEGRRICGLTRMSDDGSDSPHGSGDFCMIHLVAVRKALRIQPVLTVEDLRETGCNPRWLRSGQGTIFPVSVDEFNGILRAIRLRCPNLSDRLQAWLKKCGFIAAPSGELTSRISKGARAAGAGFATDLATKLAVERNAVKAVKRYFVNNGWKVRSVETECCGFDLICTRGNRQLDVEVKGTSGIDACFPITAGEVTQARTNPRFRLWLVTRALSRSPGCYEWSGEQLLKEFDLAPIQYMAKGQMTLQ